MTDLSSLIELAERATGPDREIDRLVHFHVECPWLAEKCVEWVPAYLDGPNEFLWWSAERKAEGKEGYHDGWESYTASVDAVLVLAGEKLAGWCFDEIGQDWEGSPTGVTGFGWTVEMVNGLTRVQGQSETFPIAILLATLRALQSKGPEA